MVENSPKIKNQLINDKYTGNSAKSDSKIRNIYIECVTNS